MQLSNAHACNTCSLGMLNYALCTNRPVPTHKMNSAANSSETTTHAIKLTYSAHRLHMNATCINFTVRILCWQVSYLSKEINRQPRFYQAVFMNLCELQLWPPLWSSGQSSWLQIRRPGFDSALPEKKSSGSGTGSTQPREYNWAVTWEKSSGSCLENQEYGRRDPSRWPHGTLYPQKLAITSPTSGGRSVGIVRSRTQTMEFFLCELQLERLKHSALPTSSNISDPPAFKPIQVYPLKKKVGLQTYNSACPVSDVSTNWPINKMASTLCTWRIKHHTF
jgi:hypothetical protein